jgi:hypothetical protein
MKESTRKALKFATKDLQVDLKVLAKGYLFCIASIAIGTSYEYLLPLAAVGAYCLAIALLATCGVICPRITEYLECKKFIEKYGYWNS